jgi:ubiquitin-protein ligase
MDLLRAVIIGPAGTPYHDGLFFFDAQFPSQYPNKPPVRIFLISHASLIDYFSFLTF